MSTYTVLNWLLFEVGYFAILLITTAAWTKSRIFFLAYEYHWHERKGKGVYYLRKDAPIPIKMAAISIILAWSGIVLVPLNIYLIN